jgi:hypothetical protein
MSDFDSRNPHDNPEPGSLADLFAEAELIFAYTRAQALADGVLVDVTALAAEAGFTFPVAITAALWADIETIPEPYDVFETPEGRLWDVLFMARFAIQRSKGGGSTLLYPLILHTDDSPGDSQYRIKLVCGPGDHAEPVITLMQPNED